MGFYLNDAAVAVALAVAAVVVYPSPAPLSLRSFLYPKYLLPYTNDSSSTHLAHPMDGNENVSRATHRHRECSLSASARAAQKCVVDFSGIPVSHSHHWTPNHCADCAVLYPAYR